MRTYIITQQEFKRKHPKGMQAATDNDYTRLANLLYELVKSQRIGDITETEIRQVALNTALYMEDVVADTGIWRGFVTKHKELYGKYLPFYDIDERDYYLDEPNLQDVEFLLWMTFANTRPGRITNPETPALHDLAVKLYMVLDEAFEQLPVNDTLKDFFEEAVFADDFYRQRDVLKWLYFECYLTSLPGALQHMEEQGRKINQILHTTDSTGFYIAECVLPFKGKTGPLALLPQEWLAMTLRYNGKEKEAETIDRQRFLDYYPILIEKADMADGFSLKTVDGEQIHVTADRMNHPEEDCYRQKVMVASLVEYEGKWWLNGDSSWSDSQAVYDTVAAQHAASKSEYDIARWKQAIHDNGDSPMFYFANLEEMRSFLTDKHLVDSMDGIDGLRLDKNNDYTLFIESDNGLLQFAPGIARCICDEHNPLYDKAYAEDHAIECLFCGNGHLTRYLADHKLLPDARINSIRGKERGRELFQNNMDFFVRMIRRGEETAQ